ncbi:unnamed protein product [Orchesella dallaii]|uniref:F-box domain-containing protein n=1 Tax=Orchesella dallaii TaxID=48710 RepID=A0ABP1RZN3_9HEXA
MWTSEKLRGHSRLLEFSRLNLDKMLSSVPILNCSVRNDASVTPGTLHPLVIEEILSEVFKHFSFAELKKFRLVCRNWEKEARHFLVTETKKWELAPIVLAKEKDVTKFLNLVGSQYSYFSFCTIYLVNFIYDPKKTPKTSKCLRIFYAHGQHIRILHLMNFVIKGNITHFIGFFLNLQRLCPNLEKLILTSPIFKESGSSKSLSSSQQNLSNIFSEPLSFYAFQQLTSLTVIQASDSKRDGFGSIRFENYLRQLFNITPNLEEFICYDRTGECVRTPLYSLIDGVQNDNLNKLNLIHLDTNRGDLHELKQFEAMEKLKIRSLQIGIDVYGMNQELSQQGLHKLLLSQQFSLTNLQLCFNVCDISQWQFKAPELPLIQELNIPYKIFSFTLLKCMSNLKKLVLRGNPKSTCWIEETDNYTIPENDIITGLNSSLSNSLELWINEFGSWTYKKPLHLRCEFIMDDASMVFFAKKFVKVHALEFGYLSEDVLLKVYEYYPELQHLSITCPPALYVSSRAYLGESKTVALNESRLSGFKLDVDTRNRVAKKIRESSNPSILRLKELKRLELIRFGTLTSVNRIHHSIECSSGFMFGISALQSVTELKLHPFVHKRAVMSLRLMPSLKVIYAVPLIIGSRETGGRSDYPTTAYWYQVLLRKRPELKIYVTTAPTSREREMGLVGTATRLLLATDVYRGNATSSGLYVYLDEYYMYQDGCEVPKPEHLESSLNFPSCSIC